jgi:diadenosine tetraphosphate (Ap4A) HIT family hydrolase
MHKKNPTIRAKEQRINFILNPLLARDCIEITNLHLSKMLLMNDRRYPWLILVPRRTAITEIHHLPSIDQRCLFDEITKVAEFLEEEFQPTKINIGAIGNIVPQLHVHVICRKFNDVAWPNPVWGHSSPVKYTSSAAMQIIKKIKRKFTKV